MKVDEEQQDLQDLLMTKAEMKALRKYEREEKKKKKILQEHPELKIDTQEPEEYTKIKDKLDMKNVPQMTDKKRLMTETRDEDGDVINDNDADDMIQEETEEDEEESESTIVDDMKKKLEIANQQLTHQRQIIEQSQQVQSIPQNMQMQTSVGTMPDLVKPRQTQDAGRVIQNQVMQPPMDDSGDVDLNKLFSSEMGNESDVVKELFSSENIKVKTDLTQDEVSIIARLELQASMTQNFFLAKVIKEMETLRVSKDRKSRQEFVNSFSGIRQDQSGATAFGKLGNIFKNDKV